MPGDTILIDRNLASGIEWGYIYPASAKNTEPVSAGLQNSNFNPFSIIASFAIALGIKHQIYSESFFMMAATQHILMEDWNSPEEDEAWADLLRER
jgi:hypothetical protein